MSMKKAFDQTIRDIKREVNKKVLKVPSVEQKVLDATSNEPWGPHGSLLADIAHATRNFHEYQMIMAVLWKRINDTGKNWRHVYKALTVLEYLVAHGSERVIDDIREHAYQISTLSDFQYIDSSGRDQGNNVRRKSQSLVVLVNDKERIEEVRQKAASNRDKFRSSSAVGGMYRPGSGDDRYEDRNGYGREREYGYRDDERYGRYGDSYNREGDRYGRESEDRYGRDSYKDDESRARSRSVEYEYGSRSRSSDRDGDRAYEEADRHSSRGSSVRAEEHPNDGRRLERKFSEQNLGAPPSYEEAIGVSRSPTYSERDGEVPAVSAPQTASPVAAAAPQSSSPISAAAPQLSSPIANTAPQSSSPIANTAPQSSSLSPNANQSLPPPNNVNATQETSEHGVSSLPNLQADPFDEFDPRGSVPAAPPSTANNAEMDLLGSLSDAFSPGPLAIMPAPSGTTDFEADNTKSTSNSSFAILSENNGVNQSFEDPFGDSPFKAIPSDDPAQAHSINSTTSFQPAMNTLEATQSGASNSEFVNAFPGVTYNAANASNAQSPPNSQFPQEPTSFQDNDILAGILPPSEPFPTTASPTSFPGARGMSPTTVTQTPFTSSTGHPQAGYSFMPQSGPSAAPFPHMTSQNLSLTPGQVAQRHSLPSFSSLPANTNPNLGLQAPSPTPSPQNDDFLGGLLPKTGPVSQSAPSSSDNLLALVPQQSPEKKFETKSTVWADTLNRGLVNLNISGSKINPLSDIGIDFESLNRKEKRMEKPSTTQATSNVSMGKAMGSGSGIGRAGAGALRPQQNPMMGSGMGMGMGGGPGVGMGNYGPVNQQPMGMGMGMGMNMGGVGMNMGQGVPMQPPMGMGQMQPANGLPPGSNMSGYNPMMGRGGYPQQPYQYGGGYR